MSQFCNPSILGKYEERLETKDRSCISINLDSEYFEFDDYPDEDPDAPANLLEREERRFERYCQKKYENSLKKGTLRTPAEWDKFNHPAKDPDVEKTMHNNTVLNSNDSVDDLNFSRIELDDFAFITNSFISVINETTVEKMNDTISEEMAMPDHIPEYHRKEENQNDVTYYLNSVNNISQFIQDKRQETIKGDWSFLYDNDVSDNESEYSASSDDTVVEVTPPPKTTQVPHIVFKNGTPKTIGYKPRTRQEVNKENHNSGRSRVRIKYGENARSGQFSDDDDIDFNVSLFQKPRTRGSTHHPSRMSKSFSAHHQTPDSLSMKLRLERLMEKHLASPGMKARAEINRINREIDEEQLGRRRLRF